MAIVLGAACSDTEVSEVYKQRLNHAIKLYNEGKVKKLIVTGGIGAGNTRSDADVAAEYLTENNKFIPYPSHGLDKNGISGI